MIKVFCIKSFKYSVSKKEIIKGNIYFTISVITTPNWSIIPIYNNNEEFLGTFHKMDFITLDEWRDQQIDKILEND